MSRKKDDKRVLISPRDNRGKSRKIRRRNTRHPPQQIPRRKTKRKRKANGITLALMILALVAFVIGAGIGISLSFDDGSQDDGPHIVNVTKEMTTNLNDTEPIYYDSSVDDVDFNDNQTLEEFNMTDDVPSY